MEHQLFLFGTSLFGIMLLSLGTSLITTLLQLGIMRATIFVAVDLPKVLDNLSHRLVIEMQSLESVEAKYVKAKLGKLVGI